MIQKKQQFQERYRNNSKKKRGIKRKYYLISDHESVIEVKKLIDGEKTWTAITPKNNTHYYRCIKVVSRSSKWCSAAVYIYKKPFIL